MRSAKPLFFFATVIVLARLAYLAVEASYNIAIVDMVSTPLLTASQAVVVEQLGHKLAAVGVALLITPPIVRFALPRERPFGFKLVMGSICAVTVFFAVVVSAFSAQTYLMDRLVKSSSPEIRYDAYYTVLFRQLYVEGAIADKGFSPSVESGPMMLAMPFAWSEVPNLDARLQTVGSGLVLERAQKQAVLERFESDYDTYLKLQELTKNFLSLYRSASQETMAKTSDDEYSIENLYGKVISTLYGRYGAYRAVNDEYRKHRQFLRDSRWFYGEISKLFRGSLNERAYSHQVVLRRAGLDDSQLDAESWCDKRCPGSVNYVASKMEAALHTQYQGRALGVPMGLSLKEFLTSQAAINAALDVAGIRKNLVFEDSKVTFDKFKTALGDVAYGPDVGSQIASAYPEIAGLYVPAGLSDEQLVNGSVFQGIVAEKFNMRFAPFDIDLSKGEFFRQWLQRSGNVIAASKDILLPRSPSQMLEEKNRAVGIASVKMLYIPAVAAVVSAVMCSLSVVAVTATALGMLGKHRSTALGTLLVSLILIGSIAVQDVAPSPTVISQWESYKSSNPVAGQLWELFFGLEQTIILATDSGAMIVEPTISNNVLDAGLGWAL